MKSAQLYKTPPGKRRSGTGPSLAGRHLLCSFLLMLAFAHTVLGQPSSAPMSATGLSGAASAQDQRFDTAFTEPEFLAVELAYPLAVEPSGTQALRLIWQMPAGYYLYQHAFRFELSRGEQVLEISPEYPESITREDEYFGLVSVYYNSADITLTADGPVAGSELVVTSQGCADAGLCYPPRTQRFEIGADGTATELIHSKAVLNRPSSVPAQNAGVGKILFMMLLAFAGGMILNLMPCVLPILSLKVVGFACASAEERHRHGLFYSAGVVASFLLVAGILFGLRGAGQSIGWGFQLQSPMFVIVLAYLFVVLGLGLSGALALGNGFVGLGSGLADQGGVRGSFFTGVLAVIVASPCTAPFMGTALGYALVQPPAVGLSVFLALGLGMAAPMFLLSYSELARRLMPKPGAWMERLKQALAFPLYATALWLFWVVGRQAGVDVMAASLLGALFLALGLWLWSGAWVARVSALICLALAVTVATWRPDTAGNTPNSLPEGSVAYSQQELESLRALGRPVFVDVTADWCITCLANERAVLSSDAVKEAFAAAGVTYMVADWTDYDAEIAEFVASHGRSGIPLYVLYADGQPPQLLPQLLRKRSVIEVLRALQQTGLKTVGIPQIAGFSGENP